MTKKIWIIISGSLLFLLIMNISFSAILLNGNHNLQNQVSQINKKLKNSINSQKETRPIATKPVVNDISTHNNERVKSFKVNKNVNDKGIIVTVKKIKLGKKTIKAYLEVKNQSHQKVNLDTIFSEIDSKKGTFEATLNLNPDLKSLSATLKPGQKSEGYLLFERKGKNVPHQFSLKFAIGSKNLYSSAIHNIMLQDIHI